MDDTRSNPERKVLTVAAVAEVGTGLVLMVDPALVVALLLGAEVSGAGRLLGRCFGAALLGLGLACWPVRQHGAGGPSAVRGMLIYNLLIALLLAHAGTAGRMGGLLLWPAVGLHAVVALWLIWAWRLARRSSGIS